MDARIVVLAGDGIGPEVTVEAAKVLDAVADKFDHTFAFDQQLMGGCAIDATGSSLPEETIVACQQADAVLLGAVGGPKWDNPNAPDRPSLLLPHLSHLLSIALLTFPFLSLILSLSLSPFSVLLPVRLSLPLYSPLRPSLFFSLSNTFLFIFLSSFSRDLLPLFTFSYSQSQFLYSFPSPRLLQILHPLFYLCFVFITFIYFPLAHSLPLFT